MLVVLPSRAAQEREAREALLHGSSIAILGGRGSGRSGFARRIARGMEPGDPRVLHLLGSPELSKVPFSHLAVLASRVPELAGYPNDPLGTLAAAGAHFAAHPTRILIDDADAVDAESAAVLAQLAAAGTTQLIAVLGPEAEPQPAAFARLLAEPHTVSIALGPLSDADARVFLEALTAERVNPSAAHTMLAEAGGSLAQLDINARAAQRDGRLVLSRGYLVLQPDESCADAGCARGAGYRQPGSDLPAAPEGTNAGSTPGATGAGRNGEETATVRAHRALRLAREGVSVSCDLIADWASDAGIPADTRLALEALRVVCESYGGDPAGALHRVFECLESELWHDASLPGRAELMYAAHLAVINEGSHELMYEARFRNLDWQELNLDHALYLVAQATNAIENGRAAEALELARESLALSQLNDPFLITGYTAAIGAAAAAMMDDRDVAEELLALHRAGTPHSGQLLRPEAERLVLWAIVAVEGVEAGVAEYTRLRTCALSAGRKFVVMRLDHEAWRLRLAGSLGDLAAAAVGVTGQLAAALRGLDDQAGIEDVASSLHGHGRTLFATEIVAQAARDARERKDSTRAHALLSLAADLATLVPDLNTPRIARVRLDPDLLSAREIEVCVRAASGLTNAAIAEELFLSPRTVEGHLQRAYAKLGVSDRRQILPD